MTTGNDLLLAAAGAGVSLVEVENSAMFDGANSEYLSRTPETPSSVRIGTLSGWFKRCEDASDRILFSQDWTGSGNNAIVVGWASDKLDISFETNVGAQIIHKVTTRVFRDTGWYHIHFWWDTGATGSSSFALTINGVAQTAFATNTDNGSAQDTGFPNTGKVFAIGRHEANANAYVNVYAAQLYFQDGVKGAATDSGEFDSTGLYWTPKADATIAALTFGNGGWFLDNVGGAEVRADISNGAHGNTTLLIHSNTSDASTTFVDSAYGKTITPAYNIQHDTAQFKFGTSSILSDGVGDALTLADHADFELGNGDFTIALWWRFDNVESAGFICKWVGSNVRSWDFGYLHSSTKLEFQFTTDGTTGTRNVIKSETWEPSADTWYHVAVTRNGNNHYLFVDGTALGSAASSSSTYYSGTATVDLFGEGGNYSGAPGWMDEILLVKGTALWTGNFTPPTTAYDGLNFINNATVVTTTNTPTNTYAILNPLIQPTSGMTQTFSNGNLTFTGSGSGGTYKGASTLYASSGKWHFECTIDNLVQEFGTGIIPIKNIATQPTGDSLMCGIMQWHERGSIDGHVINNCVDVQTNTAGNATNGQTFKCEVNLQGADSTIQWFNHSNSSLGSYTFTSSGAYAFGAIGNDAGVILTMIYNDADFKMTPTTDYLALSTTNIAAATTRTVSDVYKHWANCIYEGTGSAQDITIANETPNGSSFNPEFVWTKNRDAADEHKLVDIVRGATKELNSDSTNAESTDSNGVTSITSTGKYVLGSGAAGYNDSGENFVGWAAKLGGSAASNTSGSITSSVSVNTTLGMSVGTYTGSGSNATIGHGLSTAPEMIIVKERGATSGWYVLHTGWADATKWLELNATSALTTNASVFNSTYPTSSVFSVGTNAVTNGSSDTFMFIAFAPSEFISIGSYEGNGNVDGSFLPTISSSGIPLRPIFGFVKNIDASDDWVSFNAASSPYNEVNHFINLHDSVAEYSPAGGTKQLDMLSSGIKHRGTNGGTNAANTYIYLTIGTPTIDTDGRILGAR